MKPQEIKFRDRLRNPPHWVAVTASLAAPTLVLLATWVEARDVAALLLAGVAITCVVLYCGNRVYVNIRTLWRYPATGLRQVLLSTQTGVILAALVIAAQAASQSQPAISNALAEHGIMRGGEVCLEAIALVFPIGALVGVVALFLLACLLSEESRLGRVLFAQTSLQRAVPEEKWPNRYFIMAVEDAGGTYYKVMDVTLCTTVRVENGYFVGCNYTIFESREDGADMQEAQDACRELNNEWRASLSGCKVGE